MNIKDSVEPKRKIVMLTLTENCNLNCVYCFEKAKTKKVMSIETAKNALTYEFKNSDDFDEIEIDLFGGEPTLCMDVIKELVEWTYNQNFQKPYLFFLETNGVLVHDEIQEWLLKNAEYVWVGLSLDGTRETHNRNRCDSYDKIDIDFFVKNYTTQSIRMTVNNITVSALSKDIIHLHSLGFDKIVATFAHGVDWNIDNLTDILGDELQKLCNFYLANPQLKECSIFDMDLTKLVQTDRKIEKWCGTGTHMVSYDINGESYPCHTFQGNTTVKLNPIKSKDFDFGCVNNFSDNKCVNCIFEPSCPTCYGMNYINNGNMFDRDKSMCNIVKNTALAVSYLRAKQIETNVKEMKPNEVYQIIQAIEIIQNQY